MNRDSYHHGNLKLQALENAIKMSQDYGLFGWSLRQLAKSMSVSHVSIYNHFPTKQDLIYEISLSGFLQLIHLSQDIKDIRELGRIYIEFAIKNPIIFESMFHPQLPVSGHKEFLEASSKYVSIVKQCIDKSFFKNKDQVFLKAWASVHGYAHLQVRGAIDGIKISKRSKSISSFLDSVWTS